MCSLGGISGCKRGGTSSRRITQSHIMQAGTALSWRKGSAAAPTWDVPCFLRSYDALGSGGQLRLASWPLGGLLRGRAWSIQLLLD